MHVLNKRQQPAVVRWQVLLGENEGWFDSITEHRRLRSGSRL